MKNIYLSVFFLSLFLVVMSGCKSGSQREKDMVELNDVDLDEPESLISPEDTAGEGLPIFYNMYLSVEMSSLFQAIGAVYEPELLNSTDNISDYATSSKKAINLGVYAVDLSYARILEQVEVAGRYFTAMQKLSEQLGIPGEFFYNSAERFERNISDKDSLIIIANEVYTKTDNYLRENERYSAAALIILGGWTEALYLACNIAGDSGDIDVLERLAEQKYSLDNLIEMLKVHQEDEIVAEYLNRLLKLKPVFDRFKVDVEPEFEADSEDGKQQIQEYLGDVERIKAQITEIRNAMIS